jgi:lipopolysaccharide/colanic/teichoic acid biosynthesis glycosyltransferase
MTAHYPRIDTASAVSSATGAGASVSPRSRSGGLPVTRRPGLYRNGLKRLMDVVLVLLAAPVVLPVVLILAFCVAIDGGQPFYRQERVGKDGRIYRMWKLRSMVRDADRRLAAHLDADPAARLEWDVTQKLTHDPRITGFGAFLRRSSMDELPQLWNVLTGDMSLVGPRPMMPDQQALYPGRNYYALRPGITGTWQVSVRNTSSFADRARFDDAYDRSLSLATDLRLLAATVRVVLRGTGC